MSRGGCEMDDAKKRLQDIVNARQKLSIEVIANTLNGQAQRPGVEEERERLDREGLAAMKEVMKEMGFNED